MIKEKTVVKMTKFEMLLLIKEKLTQLFGEEAMITDFSYEFKSTKEGNCHIEIFDKNSNRVVTILVTPFAIKSTLDNNKFLNTFVFDRKLSSFYRNLMLRKDEGYFVPLCKFIIEHFNGQFLEFYKRCNPSNEDQRKFLSFSSKLLKREFKDFGYSYQGNERDLIKLGWSEEDFCKFVKVQPDEKERG